MRTLQEAIDEVGRLKERMELRDKLILELTERVKRLEKAAIGMPVRPPMKKLPFPKSLKLLGYKPPEKLKGGSRSAE